VREVVKERGRDSLSTVHVHVNDIIQDRWKTTHSECKKRWYLYQ